MERRMSRDRIYELALKAIDGDLTQDESRELDGCVSSSEELAGYYAHCISFHLTMVEIENSSKKSLFGKGDVPLDQDVWEMMAIREKIAPEIELPQEKQQPPVVVEYPQIKKKLTRWDKVKYSLVAASIIFVFSLVFMTPGQRVQVATITDSIDAKFASNTITYSTGLRLATNSEPIVMSGGFVELLFDNEAKVVIEGPAEFSINQNGIALKNGRLYSSVTEKSHGFTIDCPYNSYVDLGTEFGVAVDDRGSSELHVIKGQVELSSSENNIVQVVSQGHALAYGVTKSGSSGTRRGIVTSINISQNAFVRNINSQAGMVWRGQDHLSLGNIIAGGDGTGKVEKIIGIDPGTGITSSKLSGDYKKSNGKYNLVPDSVYIDGVFVPVKDQSNTQISSNGMTVVTPDFEGDYTHGIVAFRGTIKDYFKSIPNVVLDGKLYDDSDIVMIHSNSGITFDLDAIRRSYPEFDLRSFKTTVCLSQEMADLQIRVPYVDFFVLIDGEIVHQSKNVGTDNGGIALEVNINQNDKYLTLMVTDCPSLSDTTGVNHCNDNDFFNFIQPEIIIDPKSESVK